MGHNIEVFNTNDGRSVTLSGNGTVTRSAVPTVILS
jgi:hypothetical protein